MEEAKIYFMRNIAPGLGTMLVCILGAFLVYKGYYSGPNAASLAAMEPAAGEHMIHEHESYEDNESYIPVNTDNIPVWDGEKLITY